MSRPAMRKIDNDIDLRLFKVSHQHPGHDLSFVSALINRVVAAASINQCIYTGARCTRVYTVVQY